MRVFFRESSRRGRGIETREGREGETTQKKEEEGGRVRGREMDRSWVRIVQHEGRERDRRSVIGKSNESGEGNR